MRFILGMRREIDHFGSRSEGMMNYINMLVRVIRMRWEQKTVMNERAEIGMRQEKKKG